MCVQRELGRIEVTSDAGIRAFLESQRVEYAKAYAASGGTASLPPYKLLILEALLDTGSVDTAALALELHIVPLSIEDASFRDAVRTIHRYNRHGPDII